MKDLKSNVYVKLGIIGLLCIILLLPTTLIKGLIYERKFKQKEALEEIISKQGERQVISGPFISIPFQESIINSEGDTILLNGDKDDLIHFLPEKLHIQSQVVPEKKNRGIFDIVTFNSKNVLSGTFNMPDPKSLGIDPSHCLFEKATINLGISDLKGVQNQVEINWDGEKHRLESGLSNTNLVSSGLHVPVKIEPDKEGNYQFSFQVDLKGNEELSFLPLGKETKAHMESTWPDPKLSGNFVSDHRETSEDGFVADWNILQINRNYPQQWIGKKYSIKKSNFGAEFMITVDNYTRSMRVAKYSILFIGLTFMLFFMVEVMAKKFIHPVQYLLVGFALVVFYILLLSISEHMAFNPAYLIASSMTVILISSYAFAILKSKNVSVLLFVLMSMMYGFIFVIIQLESLAMLIGSLTSFIALTLLMFSTRKINWYDIQLGKKELS